MALNKERSRLDKSVSGICLATRMLDEALDCIELAKAESDEAMLESTGVDVQRCGEHIDQLEFLRMFTEDLDQANCFIDIQPGAGGTEAQYWAGVVVRMYMRFCMARGWNVEIMEIVAGDLAGIKSATIRVEGEYAYGWLKTETGVHRLARKSTFDSTNRRHTSFCSVFAYPEIDDRIEIAINPADLRIDVYRAQGAGGQHVNKTESAVRITYIPTNTVACSQTSKSQQQNRVEAMKRLKAKLYDLEINKRNALKDSAEEAKADISWGSQIRSYALDRQHIKDLRTGVERFDTQRVLDGDLGDFIETTLKMGIGGSAKRPESSFTH